MNVTERINKGAPHVLSRPFSGLKVVDFSTLLPGPMASLILAEGGAEITKIERPGKGDDMRAYEPRLNDYSVIFSLLNRGKASRSIDLKSPEGFAEVRALMLDADVVIEQFRPGVMARLGLSYDDVARDNPRLIYCSISGYGQDGPKVHVAGHDLNYVAEAGLLSLVTDRDGTPTLPHLPLADIGGGTYPAIINILTALYDRSRTGVGCHLDISMSENVYPFLYWALAGSLAGQEPVASQELITGGSPRYNIYRTSDGRFVAAAPLEDHFWQTFCDALQIPLCASKDDVAAAIGKYDAVGLMTLFAGRDACCSIVATIAEALEDPHFKARGVFRRQVDLNGRSVAALPLPLVGAYRDPETSRSVPPLEG
jgi:crotonobetainyl-CoA:carnitine CoA-transferase CaiB-like acyl-CoA transferase